MIRKLTTMALCFLACATPLAAQASTVIISCRITSGDAAYLKAGETHVFRIGDNRWDAWSPESAAWTQDWCETYAWDNASCTLTPARFETVTIVRGMIASITIDRTSGSLIANLHLFRSGSRPAQDSRAIGTCVPATEPAKPLTQF